MTWQTFFDTVKDMRAAQREYFRTRDFTALGISKELERKVDKLIEQHESKQQELFAGGDK